MSTAYEAFLGIGKRFTSEEDVRNFLEVHTYLVKDQIEDLLDGNTFAGLIATCLDCNSAEDWFVGYEVSIDAETMCSGLIGDVVNAHARWLEKFGDVPARVVHAVNTY